MKTCELNCTIVWPVTDLVLRRMERIENVLHGLGLLGLDFGDRRPEVLGSAQPRGNPRHGGGQSRWLSSFSHHSLIIRMVSLRMIRC